jgi:hypothetical protein
MQHVCTLDMLIPLSEGYLLVNVFFFFISEDYYDEYYAKIWLQDYQ